MPRPASRRPTRRTRRPAGERPARREAPLGEAAGTEVELTPTTVAHGGVFVARHEGRVVFVADALPGERVVARISDDRHDRFWRADAVRVLEPSPHRREHVWAEAALERDPAERAGGAEFGHIDLAQQRALKGEVLRDALTRFAGLDLPVEVAAAPGDDESRGTGWRSRVRLQVDGEGRVGPFAGRSHRVVPVTDLPLATAAVREAAPLGTVFRGSEHVDIVAPGSAGALVLPSGSGVAPVIRERVGEREFELDATGFWQVHPQAAPMLSAAVLDAVDDALLDPAAANLDLYGGVGLFAAALGDRIGRGFRVTSVEASERATEHAASNLADWVGAHTVTARVEQWLAQTLATASSAERSRLARATVILDPPRSGAGSAVIASLVELAPAQIVYVACDPVALARDLGTLAGHGWHARSLTAFDFFPNTHHLEAVVALTR